MSTISVDVIIPVYQEELGLHALYERLRGVTVNIPDIDWGYIFVNDGSPDGSYEVLKSLAEEDESVKVINLSRNFGKEVALTAGVHASMSDAVICMDADLQHPPEIIPIFIEAWLSGNDVVIGKRTGTENQPFFRKIGSNGYYWLINKISGIDQTPQSTDFRLLDKKVVEVFKRVTERERMFRGIIDWMGFKKVYVDFYADARLHGVPQYSYAKLWGLAINSITAFSLWPLRLAGYLGLALSTTTGFLLTWMSIIYLLGNSSGFTPLAFVVVLNTFFIGIVLMAIGLVALYVGTIHTEVVNRPLYIIREKINFSKSH